MRAMVIGATGFIGHHLVDVCTARSAEVVAVGRRPAADAPVPDGVERYVQADLTDPAQTLAAVRDTAPDRVFHLAGEVSVARSWSQPDIVLSANYLSTLHLLDAVRAEAPDARVLVACSSEEYGPPARLPVDEQAPLRPQNPYAASKAVGDVLAGFYADAGWLQVARTRAFNHAGPRQTETYVVASLARQIALAEREGRNEVTVTTGNADVRRDFVDVRDGARALWSVLEDGEADVYNVCTGRSTSVADILASLAEHAALTVHHRTDPGLLRPNDVMEIVGSNQRLSRATGWTPEYELSRTLRDTLDWWRGELA